jgi:dethiobiotin synthase
MTSPAPFGFFITGTDTDIGKTFISRLLADTFTEAHRVTYMKPVQTGCFRDKHGNFRAPDLEYLLHGNISLTSTYENHVPYMFEPACSPHLAARIAGEKISPEKINNCFEKVSCNRTVLTIVEGAGGAIVPVNKSEFMTDIMLSLDLPVIIVTSPGLGTINHTMLTIEALKRRSIPIAALIMNNHENLPEDFILDDNRVYLKNAIAPAPFMYVPFNGSVDNTTRTFCNELI